MFVKKQKIIHCPSCNGSIGHEPNFEYKYCIVKCRHCDKKVEVFWKCGVKLSKYE